MASLRSNSKLPRSITAGVAGLIWLTASPCSVAQTKDRRLDDALVAITALKQLVAEQDRHIAALEKAIEALQVKVAAGEDKVKTTAPAPALPWQVQFSWIRIKEGMSRAQVVEILGPPESVDSVLDYQTLIYKGEVPGSGPVTGSVKFADDRVSQVNSPAF